MSVPKYRSIVLFHNDEQKRIAEEGIADFNARERWTAPLVTEVEPLETFYPAEEEHRDFYRRNPNQPIAKRSSHPRWPSCASST
jgi:peptide-methionine (S)-S-oxide reductase